MTPSNMTNAQFREWRRSLGWKREEVALKLGISLATVGNYERGERCDRNDLKIPVLVALACSALKSGLEPLGG